MWIDRIVTDSDQDEDPEILDLHQRLTVIASSDRQRRRAVYERVYNALRGDKGSHLEVRTENSERVMAVRPRSAEEPRLVDQTSEETIELDDAQRMGLVGQLNSADEMARHLRVLHISAESALRRADTDHDMIALAQAPIDQLWTIAASIEADRETLNMVDAQGNDLTAAARERETLEEQVQDIFNKKADSDRLNKLFYIGVGCALLIAAVIILFSNPIFAAPFVLVAIGLGGAGAMASRNADLNTQHAALREQYEGSDFGVQLGRVDELFDTHSVIRKRREARESLARSMSMWAELAGNARPEVLVRERPRLEELAGHVRIINNDPSVDRDSTSARTLYGFASVLADLSRRFPTERTPFLVDDLFDGVDPTMHGVLRELLMRATNRRQVILESGNAETAHWAATEAIAGDALLITDQPIDLDSENTAGEKHVREGSL